MRAGASERGKGGGAGDEGVRVGATERGKGGGAGGESRCE